VAEELERWYDVEITLADPALGATPITATFVNQSVEDVVRIIARSIGGRYTRVGDTIRLSAPASAGARR
jgi:ferric-dicitrate binding protein FerR (iron transport regulator)